MVFTILYDNPGEKKVRVRARLAANDFFPYNGAQQRGDHELSPMPLLLP